VLRSGLKTEALAGYRARDGSLRYKARTSELAENPADFWLRTSGFRKTAESFC
jgi:hypothetical protein